MNVIKIKKFFTEVLGRYGEDRVPERSAALAFYMLVALVPLIIFGILLGELLVGTSVLEQSLTAFFEDTLGSQVAEFFGILFENVSAMQGQLLASVIGVVVIFYGLTNLTYHLRNAMVEVFDFDVAAEIEEKNTTMVEAAVRNRSLSLLWVFLFVLIFLALLLLQLSISILLSAAAALVSLESQLLFSVVEIALTLLLLTAFLITVYRGSSRSTVSWINALKGAAAGAILIVILNELFSFFLTGSQAIAAFGISGALVVFILWVYYLIQTVLIGGIVARSIGN